ncbi:type II toxin-antitoxin system RatA family toxin [Magnetospirillum molischianum]|uniref:Oligoketide cyclase/lipid transport protein n=1 Tax=Magnetospirillum molischianum DSM 120 TaxID=1150626 RepID=H8FRT3_MAGML|nr:type II toxin-antitoxin system RatA family toxin [Magnetospirillum molischianum]CCG41071.1 Oligoketide cyclase/lipid transport protein [Magnetospirillum molischianum DSM 120]
MTPPLAGQWSLDFPTHSCEQLFNIAVDIESYPRFLPFCRTARIRHRHGNVLDVDNAFGAGPIQAHFQTRAVFDPPHRLEITSRQAPFTLFRLIWSFTPLPGGGCRVNAAYHVALRSSLLQSLARLSLPEFERRVLSGFRHQVSVVSGG